MSNPPFSYQPTFRFTPEEAQRQVYLLLCQGVSAEQTAQRVGISLDTVHRLRRAFGITIYHKRPWTQQDDWELRNLVDQHLHIRIIAKRLYRSVQAVQRRINGLGIERIHNNGHTYTMAQVSRMLQVGISQVLRWIEHKLLKATKITTRGAKKRHVFYRIDALNLYDFLANPKHWHLYRVEDITDEFLRRDLVAVHRETPSWLYIDDITERYTVSLGAVRNWCRLGKIPYELIIRTYVFDPAKLADWVPPYKSSQPYKYGSRVLKRAMAAYPDLLTAQQVAERYGFTVGTINEWSMAGIIPFRAQVGRYRLYDPEQLANWTPPNRAMNSVAVRAALAERPELITIDQLAERYNVTRETVYYWYTRGWITAIKVGKVLMFDGQQLQNWEPPYVRDRKNAAYRSAASCDRPCHDRDDEPGRLAGGAETGDGIAEIDTASCRGGTGREVSSMAQEHSQ